MWGDKFLVTSIITFICCIHTFNSKGLLGGAIINGNNKHNSPFAKRLRNHGIRLRLSGLTVEFLRHLRPKAVNVWKVKHAESSSSKTKANGQPLFAC